MERQKLGARVVQAKMSRVVWELRDARPEVPSDRPGPCTSPELSTPMTEAEEGATHVGKGCKHKKRFLVFHAAEHDGETAAQHLIGKPRSLKMEIMSLVLLLFPFGPASFPCLGDDGCRRSGRQVGKYGASTFSPYGVKDSSSKNRLRSTG
jgi:hypothetical protein